MGWGGVGWGAEKGRSVGGTGTCSDDSEKVAFSGRLEPNTVSQLTAIEIITRIFLRKPLHFK